MHECNGDLQNEIDKGDSRQTQKISKNDSSMLRRGTGDPRTLSSAEYEHGKQNHDLPVDRTPTVRGLLKLLQGQISNENEPLVAVHRYHGPTLRESQKKLQKKKRSTTGQEHSNDGESPLLIPKHSMAFKTIVRRHKFVAFFVVQGFRNVGGNTYYSAHTLNLRRILATDYHDVMTTFVLDLGGGSNNSNAAIGFGDEEIGGGSSDESSSSFCNGTGFCMFPTDGGSVSTLLALLNVSKIPAVVVLDAFSGRIMVKDAILSIERNDSHTVINRWQSGRSGLSILQQLGAVATCDCSHGPCCSGSGGGCCVVQ